MNFMNRVEGVRASGMDHGVEMSGEKVASVVNRLDITPIPLQTHQEDEKHLSDLAKNPPETILVVSDFHLGMGSDLTTGLVTQRENFFRDRTFARFLAFHKPKPQRSVLLVLNGDSYDFLRIPSVPQTCEELNYWSHTLARLRCHKSPDDLKKAISRREKKFGLRTDDYKSAWKFLRIAQGHPTFFKALAEWVEWGGWVLFVKGNHDLELHWPLVRLAIRDVIHCQGASPEKATERISFCDNSVQMANIYIEHGHRYETLTRVVGPPILPKKETQLNLPLGSFGNRYLVNPIEELEPFIDNIKPIQELLWTLLRRHPLKMLGILYRSWWFFSRIVQHCFRLGPVEGFQSVWDLLPYLGSLLVSFFVVVSFTVGWIWQSHWHPALSVLGLVGLIAPCVLVRKFRQKWPQFFQALHRFVGFLLYLGALGVTVWVGWRIAPQVWGYLKNVSYRIRILGFLGLVAPYLVGVLRDIFPRDLWPRRFPQVGEDHFAEGAHAALECHDQHSKAQVLYSVMGHTHVQDVQSLPPIGASRVLYLNSGTWTPLWQKDRPDQIGHIFHPFIRFTKDGSDASDEYKHTYLEWNDDRNAPAESLILDPRHR